MESNCLPFVAPDWASSQSNWTNSRTKHLPFCWVTDDRSNLWDNRREGCDRSKLFWSTGSNASATFSTLFLSFNPHSPKCPVHSLTLILELWMNSASPKQKRSWTSSTCYTITWSNSSRCTWNQCCEAFRDTILTDKLKQNGGDILCKGLQQVHFEFQNNIKCMHK